MCERKKKTLHNRDLPVTRFPISRNLQVSSRKYLLYFHYYVVIYS